MRKVGHDRRLPIVVPAQAETISESIACATCDRGYRAVAGELGHLSGNVYWQHRRTLEDQHGHFLFMGYPADQSLRWEFHCDACHTAGEAL